MVNVLLEDVDYKWVYLGMDLSRVSVAKVVQTVLKVCVLNSEHLQFFKVVKAPV